MRALSLILLLLFLGCDADRDQAGDSTHAPATHGATSALMLQPSAAKKAKKAKAKAKRPKKSVVACVAQMFRGPDDHGQTTTTAGALAVGDAKTGRLERADDVDLFSVALEAGQAYDLSVHGFGRFRLVLLDVDGKTELAKGEKTLRHRPAHAGLHYVRLENAGAQPQDYALEVLKAKQ